MLKNWRTSLLVVAGLVIVGQIAVWRHALIEEGKAIARVQQLDSLLAQNKTALARVDTLVVHDTLRVTATRLRVDSLRDTVLTHLTDTVLVKEFVARTDTALKTCTELSNDCAAFRRLAQQRFDAYEAKLKEQPVAVARSCIASNITTGILAGLVTHFVLRK
jgi:hypothetical protein